jgi:hypothetical protein
MNTRSRRLARARRSHRDSAFAVRSAPILVRSHCFGCAEGEDGAGHFQCFRPVPPRGYQVTGEGRELTPNGWVEEARRVA